MSKGGGGGYDTSAMEAATREATALQKQIYEEGKQMAQPWYQTGTSAIGRLADLMGLQGGSKKTREQLVKELSPQYTGATGGGATSAAGNWYVTNDGRMVNVADPKQFDTVFQGANTGRMNPTELRFLQGATAMNKADEAQRAKFASEYGFTPYQTTQAATTDQSGLNAAVEAALAAQEANTPEGFGSLAKSFTSADYQEDPVYKFRLAEGEKAIERAMAARGKTFTPEAAKALTGYGQGLASEEYGNAYNRFNINQESLFNRLAALSGSGQTATGQLAQGGQNYATNVGNLTTNLANAQTAAQVAKASRPSMFSQLLSTGAQVAGAYYSDRQLKENIELIDTVEGVNRYRFNYKGDDKAYIGAIAQQVQDVKPEAVSVANNGYLMVNYDLLPFKMEVA